MVDTGDEGGERAAREEAEFQFESPPSATSRLDLGRRAHEASADAQRSRRRRSAEWGFGPCDESRLVGERRRPPWTGPRAPPSILSILVGETLLDGVRVVDAAGEPGALGGRILADLGAEVVRLEPPGGDPLRWVAPRFP